jgi:hypothetical protein
MSALRILMAGAVLFGAATPFVHAQAPRSEAQSMSSHGQSARHPYVGMWVTRDGHVRQELLPSGRYDEARGMRRSAYQGRYEVRGNEIFYWDDTGFTADGVFANENQLSHGGMTFFRER